MSQSEFATFIEAGRYLRGWSDRTVRTYNQGLSTLGTTPLTKAGLASWVVRQPLPNVNRTNRMFGV